MNALKFIIDKYKVRGAKSPIYLECSRAGTLPKLFKGFGFTLGAEIGVEVGIFAKALCKDNPMLKLYCIDSWKSYKGYRDTISPRLAEKYWNKLYRYTKDRLKPFSCQLVRDSSMDVVRRFADESLDFVYIDANHDYQHVKEDIAEWSKKVKKGGIVSGHDFVDNLPGQATGVRRAVLEWTKKNNMEHLFILKKDTAPSWMFVKK